MYAPREKPKMQILSPSVSAADISFGFLKSNDGLQFSIRNEYPATQVVSEELVPVEAL